MPILIRKVHLKIWCVSLVHIVLVVYRMVPLDNYMQHRKNIPCLKHCKIFVQEGEFLTVPSLLMSVLSRGPHRSAGLTLSQWLLSSHLFWSTLVVSGSASLGWDLWACTSNKGWVGRVCYCQNHTLRTSVIKEQESAISIVTKMIIVVFRCVTFVVYFYLVSFSTDRIKGVISAMLL